MQLKRILKIVYYALVVTLLLVAFYKIYAGNEREGSSFGVWQGVIYCGIATAAALVLAALGLINNPKSAIWFLSGIGVLAVLYVIGKNIAGDTVPQKFADAGITLGTVQNSEAGVWISIVLLGLTALLAIASGVKSMLD